MVFDSSMDKYSPSSRPVFSDLRGNVKDMDMLGEGFYKTSDTATSTGSPSLTVKQAGSARTAE
ncbi:hypothetical protein PHISCL_01916 [Aspergillus sclerotialis]|uniref:Uncharacterized protein n=1 Tax=Aspergillus sclerotialis TaxID=2070753 RepID=A0A3A2ZRF1_9EURO|nr:hypothetical protein PHISCL_01916 [Aspergillus sclerotialis]